jgi:hypothetical protein
MTEGNRPPIFVRARQRSRTALPAFDGHMIPTISEVGIDRIQISVAGSWHISRAGQSPQMAVEDFFGSLGVSHEVDWFRSPEERANLWLIRTRSNAATTLGPTEISVRGRNDGRGRININLKGANPTRTLAHLLADHGTEAGFANAISALSPSRFFALANNSIPRAIGSSPDNWLPEPDVVVRCLGRNPFAVFLPIYVGQLQRLIAEMLSPFAPSQMVPEGPDMVWSEHGLVVRVEWGRARVPQIESYFERHHGGAVGAVRSAAVVALGEADMADVRRYSRPVSDWIERQDDCLSIGLPLTDRYRLGIYAKSPDRLRFEVRRFKKGDYSGLASPAQPHDWLLGIMNMERHKLLDAMSWPRVGAMFNEQPNPQMSDLIRLCSLIAQACSEYGLDVQSVMARLFEDGGITRNGHDDVPTAFLQRLCRAGVLHHLVVGRRDHPRPRKRYSLTPEYRHLMDAVMVSLSSGQGV